MSYAAARIDEFHEAFGVERADRSDKASVKRNAKAREKLHVEEHVELEEALDTLVRFGGKPDEHLAEELADLMVIAYGTADVLGIDLDTAFAIKMNANMAKLPDCPLCSEADEPPVPGIVCAACNGTGKGSPIKREDGKILKPEGWQKPSFAEAIR